MSSCGRAPTPVRYIRKYLATDSSHRERSPRFAARVEYGRLPAPPRLRQRAEAVVHIGGRVLVRNRHRGCHQAGNRKRFGQQQRIVRAWMRQMHHAVQCGNRHRDRRFVRPHQWLPLTRRVWRGRKMRYRKGARRPGVDSGVVLRAAVSVGLHSDGVERRRVVRNRYSSSWFRGAFTIKYSASPSVPKAIGPSLRAASTGTVSPQASPCGPVQRMRVETTPDSSRWANMSLVSRANDARAKVAASAAAGDVSDDHP